jgi:hypothetical protein
MVKDPFFSDQVNGEAREVLPFEIPAQVFLEHKSFI